MSNLNTSLQFLRQSPQSNFLVIANLENDTRIGNPKVYLADIAGEDLERFIKYNLGSTTTDVDVWIEHRKDVGSTNRKDEKTPSYKVRVSAIAPAIEPPPAANLPVVHQGAPVPASPFLGTPHPGHHFGLGFSEILQMNVNSMRVEDLKAALTELKEDYKDIKQEKRLLEVEHRELQSKFAIAESQKEMAVLMAKNETKSFMDSPAFEKIIEMAPQILAAHKGVPLEAGAGLGSPDVSEAVQEVIDYIAENCNDFQANLVGSIFSFIDNPAFVNEFTTMLQKYKGHE